MMGLFYLGLSSFNLESSWSDIKIKIYVIQYRYIMIKYSFQCRTKQNKYRADLSTLKLTFTNNQEIITFNLTLNLHIHWLSSSRLLIGFQIENREFYSEHKALMKLKTKLSLKVIFHGVNHFYKTLNHLGQGSSGTVLLA